MAKDKEDNHEQEVKVEKKTVSKRLSTIQLEGLSAMLAKKEMMAEKEEDNYEKEVKVESRQASKRLSSLQLGDINSVISRKSLMMSMGESVPE